MNNVARVFDEQNNVNAFRGLSQEGQGLENADAPWATVANSAMPPMMFQLRFHDGRMVSFAYSDLREVRCHSAGRVELFVHAMSKLAIRIEGRHLRDLANWFSTAGIQWIREADPRNVERLESDAEIVTITVEEIPD